MTQNKKVVIIDYQMSNMFSVQNALAMLGIESEIVQDAKSLLSADIAILPGVGAFRETMSFIRTLDLELPIKDFIESGRPFIGICLGLQLLFSESEEFGTTKGLNIIEGTVEHLSKQAFKLTTPHIGWNKIKFNNHHNNELELSKTPFKNFMDNEYMYFVHSYFVNPVNKDVICTNTTYGDFNFCSSIQMKNIFACQFHPEKSGSVGLQILKNYFDNAGVINWDSSAVI